MLLNGSMGTADPYPCLCKDQRLQGLYLSSWSTRRGFDL